MTRILLLWLACVAAGARAEPVLPQVHVHSSGMGGANAPRSPAEGADTAVWLALDAPRSLTGKFVRDRAVIPW